MLLISIQVNHRSQVPNGTARLCQDKPLLHPQNGLPQAQVIVVSSLKWKSILTVKMNCGQWVFRCCKKLLSRVIDHHPLPGLPHTFLRPHQLKDRNRSVRRHRHLRQKSHHPRPCFLQRQRLHSHKARRHHPYLFICGEECLILPHQRQLSRIVQASVVSWFQTRTPQANHSHNRRHVVSSYMFRSLISLPCYRTCLGLKLMATCLREIKRMNPWVPQHISHSVPVNLTVMTATDRHLKCIFNRI
jgi:hypothetical protein